jgi:hypothetical protein
MSNHLIEHPAITIIFVLVIVCILIIATVPKKCKRCNHYDMHEEYSTGKHFWGIYITHICKHCYYTYTTSLTQRIKTIFKKHH